MSLVGERTVAPSEDEAVTVVERMLVEALRASAADKDADDQPAKQMTTEAEVTLAQATRALKKRLEAQDPKEPKSGSGRDDKDDRHDHNQDNYKQDNRKQDNHNQDNHKQNNHKQNNHKQNNHKQNNHKQNNHNQVNDNQVNHDDEALVARFVRSSLDIALPRIEERDSDGQVTQTQSALSYGEVNHSIVLNSTTTSPVLASNTGSSSSVASSRAVTPSGGLPAGTQKELDTKTRNYLTWDKEIYADLSLDSESIRLIEIRPGSSPQIEVDLIKRPLDEVKNAYEALSYTWGSPSPKETIIANGVNANGVRVEINQWLFGALSSLRLPNTKRRLWVDAICINQASVAERSIEVQKMGEIYSLAETVVIFHGWPSTTTREGSLITALFKFLARSDPNGTSNTESAQTNGNVDDPFRSCGLGKALVCKGFIDFCCRPWWRRVWTMQEFYLATEEPVWYWGSTGVSNTTLKRDMPLLMKASWELYGQKEVESWIPKHVEKSTGKPVAQFSDEIRRISDLIARRNKTHGDIPSRFYRSLSAQATDPRDLVYGLREIFDPVFRRVFVPDYSMRLELLYACLAVFLIQFEGWGDMLWWYPHRFQAKGLPSWLPDFTKRVVPAVTELLPRDHLATSTLHLKLVVLNHALHVEGYKLDRIEAFTLMIKEDETDVLRDLWKFEGSFNRNRSYLQYVLTKEEQKNPQFNSFLTICRTLTSRDDSGIAHPRLSVLNWMAKSNTEDDLPSTVVEFLPCWDILMWHAFKIGSKSDSTRPGILSDIFSSRLSDAFQKILATDFIGDCVFDWHSLEHVLDRLASESPWSDPNSPYWQTLAEASSTEQDEFGKDLATRVSSFLASLKATNPDLMGDLDRFHRLCSLVLLDSSCYTSFVHILDKLRSAGERLHKLALDWRVEASVDDLGSKDELVAARVRQNVIIKSHFSGRSLFWTRQGFHDLTTPGTQLCERADDVLLLNGLSSPMVVKDFNQEDCTGRLVGCAIVRGVDLLDSEAETPKVPEGFALGEKRLFKFT
ncbi:HET-domain-containing protein [Byssothecium circinans]|uniref:HET-domain-containing protein n=1 Tax=Byssothecium circinans TaxID=147558 RepID=A0A6A5TYS1_9PLEO|nr:HET-domain-containing protein [Byssothecium circinans]